MGRPPRRWTPSSGRSRRRGTRAAAWRGFGQAGGGGFRLGLLALLDGLLARQLLVGVGALRAGVADGVQEPADLADVVPAGRYAGTGGRKQAGRVVWVAARFPDRPRFPGRPWIPGQSGRSRRPRCPSAGRRRPRRSACLAAAARESAARRESLATSSVRPAIAAAAGVDAGALAGDIGGPGGDLAALVLDAALGLVLLGVLQALEAALQALALGPAGLAVGLGGALGVGGAGAGGGRAAPAVRRARRPRRTWPAPGRGRT